MNESAFWSYIKNYIEGWLERIESPSSVGFADVIMTRDEHTPVTSYVELKYKSKFTKSMGLSPDQLIWHRKSVRYGRRSFLLARLDKKVYLLPSKDILNLFTSEADLASKASLVMHVGKIDKKLLSDAIYGSTTCQNTQSEKS